MLACAGSSYGITWKPIFDEQPTGSIGAIAVAPSNPNIVYAGSGEGLQRPDLSTGDGVYKSVDAGKTWTRLGLRDGQQMTQIIVDPKNPDRLFVAVLGHPYGPNEERGVFRSTDGGRSFQKVSRSKFSTGADRQSVDTPATTSRSSSRTKGNVPYYWIRPSRILSAAPGLHRFIWDLHYPPPPGSTVRYPIMTKSYDSGNLPLSAPVVQTFTGDWHTGGPTRFDVNVPAVVLQVAAPRWT